MGKCKNCNLMFGIRDEDFEELNKYLRKNSITCAFCDLNEAWNGLIGSIKEEIFNLISRFRQK